MNIKIVSDSASDIITLDGVSYASAPLKIITAEKEYIDVPELDVFNMVTTLKQYKGRSSTSCPNSADWLAAFGDADAVFCVTITGTLSGSYNSAMLAKQEYEHDGRRVFVLDSLSAGPEIGLIIIKLCELVRSGMDFDSICTAITEYKNKTGLLFILESLQNFANNGRVKPAVAKMAGLFGIRIVGKASDKGDLEPLNKCRGETKSIAAVIGHLRDAGLSSGKVRIGHCFNAVTAAVLEKEIKKAFPNCSIDIYELRGLCSFYAEIGGILIGFEKY
ncbi:MAG: DegV family protein [Ruminococcaceae bacterium]|nr:DegV family protein [Oscillospiraceae bacterium]